MIREHCAVSCIRIGNNACPEPADAPCRPACCRAWLQAAGITIPVRASAYHPHPDQPPVGEGKPQSGFRTSPAGTVRPDPAGDGVDGRHHCEGSSRRNRFVKKRFAGHRQVPWEMDRRDPSGCLGARTAAVFPPSPDMSTMRSTRTCTVENTAAAKPHISCLK